MAFDNAIALLECSPADVEILVGPQNIAAAFLVAKQFGCYVLTVPDELIKTPYAWAVRNPKIGAMVWCEGGPA